MPDLCVKTTATTGDPYETLDLKELTMRNILIIIACLCIPFSAYAANTSDINMNAGNWEITTAMDTTGLPFSVPPMVDSMCLTNYDLIPQSDNGEHGDDCEIVQQSVSGDTVSWEIECLSDEGKIVSSGSITYKGDSFNGKITIQMPEMGVINQHVSGRRIGNCD